MDRANYRNYCDKAKKEPENLFFVFEARGASAVCAVAYPQAGSFSYSACEKALRIGAGSFLQRPSLSDEALETITGFINEGIYILQEPGKTTFCSLAILYILRGRARFVISGNAKICHFQEGRFTDISQGYENPLLGKSMRVHPKIAPAFDISKEINGFLLYCGEESKDFSDEWNGKEFFSIEDANHWTGAVISKWHGQACSAGTLVLPKKRQGLSGLFHLIGKNVLQ